MLRNTAKKATKRVGRAFGVSDIIDQLNQLNHHLNTLQSENTALRHQLDQQSATLDHQNHLLDHLSQELNHSRERQEHLIGELARTNKVSELYFEALYGKKSETTADLRRRFFTSMPSAAGDLRTFQQGNAKLLRVLTALCQKHHLPYWLQSGTLLGAVRHHGFVPWDDDTDIAMFRADIKTLRQLLAHDKNYQVTLIYDWYVKSRQIRFRTTNPENPCFIDIYIYDYGTDSSPAAWEKWHQRKQEITAALEKDPSPAIAAWRDQQQWVNDNTALGKELRAIFSKHYPHPKTPSTRQSPAIVWGLDNFPVKWRRLFDWDFIFPTVPLSYEGAQYQAPHQYDAYLQRQYGDIYSLPADLVSHYQHIDHNNFHADVIKEFLAQDG